MRKGAAACSRSPSSQVHKCPDRAASWHVRVCGIPPCDHARSPGHTGSGWSALQWPPLHSPRSSAATGSGWLSPSGESGSRTGPHCSRSRIPVEEREGERRGKGLSIDLAQNWGDRHLELVSLPCSGKRGPHSTAFCILEAIKLLDQGGGCGLRDQGLNLGFNT